MGAVKGIARVQDVERIAFEVDGVDYWIEVFADPPARIWNDLKKTVPNEAPFDTDTRVLHVSVQEWDLGVDVTKEAIEGLLEPVRAAMVWLVTKFYLDLQQKHSGLLEHIYRPGGDGDAVDPTPGAATASASPKPSRGSRRTA